MAKKPPKKQGPNAAVPPQRRRRKTGKEVRTSLQIIPKANLDQPADIRDLFCVIFEETCGNISATCELLKIDRKTYYNWVSKDPEFAAKIAEIRADERFVDVAEFSLLQKVRDGDVAATIFTLKTKGRKRGWNDRPDVIVINTDVLDRVAQAYQAFLSDHPELTAEDKWKWLVRFANGAKEPVEPEQLAKKVGLNPAQQGANE